MLLDVNNRKLQLALMSAIATYPLAVTVEYEDEIREQVKPETIFTETGSSGSTDILLAPEHNTARRIIEIHVYNADTVSQQIQVLIEHGVSTQVIQNATLDSGDTLHYNRYNGWDISAAGASGRGPVMRKYRSVIANTSVGLLDDIIDVDASSGNVIVTFDATIVTAALIALGFAKEVTVNKIDATANTVTIKDGSAATIETLSFPSTSHCYSQGITVRAD